MANVVDFAESILGIGNNGSSVARCLRLIAERYEIDIGLRMIAVADDLESGKDIEIERLRKIGEQPLADTQRLFLNL